MRLKIIFCKHTWQTEVLANFQKPSKEERKQTQCIVSEIILKYWLSKVSNLLLDLSNVTNWTNSFFLQKNLPHLIIAEEVTEVGIISALQIGNRKKKKKQETWIERVLSVSKRKPLSQTMVLKYKVNHIPSPPNHVWKHPPESGSSTAKYFTFPYLMLIHPPFKLNMKLKDNVIFTAQCILY